MRRSASLPSLLSFCASVFAAALERCAEEPKGKGEGVGRTGRSTYRTRKKKQNVHERRRRSGKSGVSVFSVLVVAVLSLSRLLTHTHTHAPALPRPPFLCSLRCSVALFYVFCCCCSLVGCCGWRISHPPSSFLRRSARSVSMYQVAHCLHVKYLQQQQRPQSITAVPAAHNDGDDAV